MSSLMEQPLDLVNNLQQQISCVLVLFVAWVVFYVVVDQTLNTKGLSRKKELDTKNRIVSIVHGLVTFILGMMQFFPLASFDLPNTPIQSFTNMFALSYSVYDVIACVYFGISDTGFLLHHLFCWAAFGTVAFSGWGGIASMGGFVVAEISNFPMHIRTILKNYSLRYTLAYEFCEILYIVLYVFARGIFCPFFVLYPCLLSVNTPFVVKLMCFALTAQSFYYIWKMIAIVKNKLRQYKEMREKKISYSWFCENFQVEKLSFYKGTDGPKVF